MHEHQNSKFLHLCPERIVFRSRRHFSSGVTCDSDTPKTQLPDGFVQLLRGHLRMLQRNRSQAGKPVRMRLTPGGKLFVLDGDDPARQLTIGFVPPCTLMAQNLYIDTQLIENLEPLRTEH